MGLRRLLVRMLDPEGGTDGQGIVIAGGKFTVADLPSAGGIESIVPGAGIDVDDTDPANPVVSATGGGGGTGLVPLTTIVGGVPDLVWDADNQLVMTEAP